MQQVQRLMACRTNSITSPLHFPKFSSRHYHNPTHSFPKPSTSTFTKASSHQDAIVRDPVPKHAAVFLDGNRRWCISKGIPDTDLYLFERSIDFALLCSKWGIPFATSFIFITENWTRSKEWCDRIFEEFESYFKENLEIFKRHEMRVSVIGELSRAPKSLQEEIVHVEEATKHHTRVHIIFGLNYGGRMDIVQAARKIGENVKKGIVEPKDIDETTIEKELCTNICGQLIPDPDLVIYTGNTIGLSNYLLWQMAYSELYFSDILAPDFSEDVFTEALQSFQRRERRYGK